MSEHQREHPPAASGSAPAYHIELRQFPHNVCHFNLTEQQLRVTIVEPWARERWIEMGDRKWNPNQAKLTVIEGPHIPVEELSMGRGWRTAQREGQDVTERLLERVRGEMAGDAQALAGAGQVPGGLGQAPGVGQSGGPAGEVRAGDARGATPQAPELGLLADSLGLELLGQLGDGQAPLRSAWELAIKRYPERTAGEGLALAERAIASLLRSRLVALTSEGATDGAGQDMDESEAQAALRAIDSWTGVSGGSVWISKA